MVINFQSLTMTVLFRRTYNELMLIFFFIKKSLFNFVEFESEKTQTMKNKRINHKTLNCIIYTS